MTRALLVFAAVAGPCALLAQAQQPQAQGPVIGKLGQTTQAAKIHKSLSTKSAVYWTTKQFDYIIINQSKSSNWFAVKLQNGKVGYIESGKVARLPYEVRANGVQQPARPAVQPSRGGSVPGRTGAVNSDKQRILQYSFNFIGTPYVWGGNSLERGIDCSGFVKELYNKIGIHLPRTAASQALVGTKIETISELLPGDRLYFWDSKRGKIGHTGLFLGFYADGRGYFIHSSSGRKGVQTDLLTERWQKILVDARRD